MLHGIQRSGIFRGYQHGSNPDTHSFFQIDNNFSHVHGAIDVVVIVIKDLPQLWKVEPQVLITKYGEGWGRCEAAVGEVSFYLRSW